MTRLTDNPAFAARYRDLARVTLNPRRHTAANALAHSEQVARRAAALAAANGCAPDDAALLEDLGRAHDIGKVTGTARPEKSLHVLAECGVTDERLLALVKWHDTNLPWWTSARRGQPPSDAAWRRIARDVELRLLAIFMVADRVDAPGGWRRNAPLVWFHEQARARGLLEPLVLDLPGEPSEISSGGILVDDAGRGLLIRLRARGLELPKGGIEWDELPEDAALRELREETGLTGDVAITRRLGELAYQYREGDESWWKHVHVFAMRANGPLAEGQLPAGTRERCWVTPADAATVALTDESLRPLLVAALGA